MARSQRQTNRITQSGAKRKPSEKIDSKMTEKKEGRQ